jgi:hypothetical protein
MLSSIGLGSRPSLGDLDLKKEEAIGRSQTSAGLLYRDQVELTEVRRAGQDDSEVDERGAPIRACDQESRSASA